MHPPNTPQRVFVVLNPVHRSARRAASELARQAAASGRPLTILRTSVAEPGGSQARAALDAGARLVVVVGGDGTVRQVAGALAGSGVPLGIVPTGTANLFARNLGLPARLSGQVSTALIGTPTSSDIGWARSRHGDEWSGEQPFLVVAGIGRDAATVLATRPWLKRRLSWLAYFEAGLRHSWRPPVPMTVAVDGRPERAVDAWCVLAGNHGRLPAGITVFADARGDDGVLDTLIVAVKRPWHWASVAAKGVLHVSSDVAALDYGRAHDVVVRPRTPQPVHLDGDPFPAVDEARWRVAASELIVLTRGPN
ncbi:MAG TPA: diacylglycerol kinase family protein [Propioniciclava tarda]|nr:diacylglycerol kinase family protein [Propioniciclava tarda]HQA30495.1 diacylglycerol kinase family protein [Propioniciclava tarda]HQD61144.1 diacylglycerol kinase family protein [Propioniciclava tarda]